MEEFNFKDAYAACEILQISKMLGYSEYDSMLRKRIRDVELSGEYYNDEKFCFYLLFFAEEVFNNEKTINDTTYNYKLPKTNHLTEINDRVWKALSFNVHWKYFALKPQGRSLIKEMIQSIDDANFLKWPLVKQPGKNIEDHVSCICNLFLLWKNGDIPKNQMALYELDSQWVISHFEKLNEQFQELIDTNHHFLANEEEVTQAIAFMRVVTVAIKYFSHEIDEHVIEAMTDQVVAFGSIIYLTIVPDKDVTDSVDFYNNFRISFLAFHHLVGKQIKVENFHLSIRAINEKMHNYAPNNVYVYRGATVNTHSKHMKLRKISEKQKSTLLKELGGVEPQQTRAEYVLKMALVYYFPDEEDEDNENIRHFIAAEKKRFIEHFETN